MKKLKHKRLWIILLIGVLYFAGVLMVIYPMFGNIYSMSTSRTAITNYQKAVEQLPDTTIDNLLETADRYNRNLAAGVIDPEDSTALNGQDNIMCYVEVPSLGIYLPVYYGTGEDVLKKGCGWLENTSLPVGGKSTHSVISGHTGLPNAEMLTKLDMVQKGDLFYLYVLDKTLVYQVDSIEAVAPNRTELLTIVPDMDYVTLLTCTPYGINDKRLLVRGERLLPPVPAQTASEPEAEPVSEALPAADAALTNQIRHDSLIISLIAAASVVVFVVACIWLNAAIKKKPHPAKYARKEKQSGDEHAKEEKEE